MDCFPMQTNASFTSLPANTSDTCCLPKASPWPLNIGPKSSRLAGTPEIQRHPVFPRIHQLLLSFHFRILQITILLTHLTCKGTLGTSLMSAVQPLKALKKAFTTAPVLTHWILDTQLQLRLMLPTTCSLLSFQFMTSNGELHPIAFHSRTFSTP